MQILFACYRASVGSSSLSFGSLASKVISAVIGAIG